MGPLTRVVESALELLTSAVSRGSYPAILSLMALESALIPVPSEIVMPLSGFLVVRGEMTFWGAVTAGVLGNLIGSLAAYRLGRTFGWDGLARLIGGLPWAPRELERADLFFRRWGRHAVFLGRMMPAVRTFISLPAGMSGIPEWEFALLTVLGSVPWNLALVWAGMILGENWPAVRNFVDPLILAAAAAALIYACAVRRRE